MIVSYLAQLQPTAPVPSDDVGTGEEVAFWILAPLALGGALGMVFARNAVHSALWLVLTMLSLGAMYMAQQAPFLGFVQIIVYTGAIMMLFLFVLMLVGRDSSDSVVEVIRGQRVAALLVGIGFAGLLVSALARAFEDVEPVGLREPNETGGGNVDKIGRSLFTDYLFPFELTSALLITAAVGAMILAFTDKERKPRITQRSMVEARLRGNRPSPLPGPGVFATMNSVAVPALLPDGSVSKDSLFEIIEATSREIIDEDLRQVSSEIGSDADAHSLRGPVDPAPEEDGR